MAYKPGSGRRPDPVENSPGLPRWLTDLGDRPPSLRFSGHDVLGPLVYLVERDGQPLYVGISTCGLRRPLDRRHHALSDLQPSDTFYVWRFEDEGGAWAFETHLIARLQPDRNTRGVYPHGVGSRLAKYGP